MIFRNKNSGQFSLQPKIIGREDEFEKKKTVWKVLSWTGIPGDKGNFQSLFWDTAPRKDLPQIIARQSRKNQDRRSASKSSSLGFTPRHSLFGARCLVGNINRRLGGMGGFCLDCLCGAVFLRVIFLRKGSATSGLSQGFQGRGSLYWRQLGLPPPRHWEAPW